MQWDLIAEHYGAYDEEVCKKIDELTDLFDIILDDLKLYPSMMCVDVFPYTENLAIEIPKHIQNYYKIYSDEGYKVKMQKSFASRLDLEKRENCSVYDAIRSIFDSDFLLDRCETRPVNHNINIQKVADRISEEVGTSLAECFGVNKQDLNKLQEVYIGILFFGWVLRCGNFGFLILLGTNE